MGQPGQPTGKLFSGTRLPVVILWQEIDKLIWWLNWDSTGPWIRCVKKKCKQVWSLTFTNSSLPEMFPGLWQYLREKATDLI